MINTIHCPNCKCGFDMPTTAETHHCPHCDHLIEVTVKDKGELPF